MKRATLIFIMALILGAGAIGYLLERDPSDSRDSQTATARRWDYWGPDATVSKAVRP